MQSCPYSSSSVDSELLAVTPTLTVLRLVDISLMQKKIQQQSYQLSAQAKNLWWLQLILLTGTFRHPSEKKMFRSLPIAPNIKETHDIVSGI